VRLPALSFRRFAAVAPYAVCFAATWSLLGLESNVRVAEVATALALQLVVGVLLFWAPSWGRSRWARAGGVIMFLASVWLLRDGVGQTAGYGSLVLLPVISASLRNRRAELIWVIAGAGLVLFAPLVVIGGAHYPQSGWRSGGLVLVIAAALGVAVLELVARLRSSDDRQRLLAENSTDLVARFAPDGTTTYASPASGPLLGYAPDELVGLNITDLLHPQDRYAQNARRARIDETPDAIMQEFRLRHRDGRWIWFEAAIRSIRDTTGAVSGRQGAIRQIQERKRLQGIVERQRDEATNLLAEQSALREIATLVAAGAQPDAVFAAVAAQLARLFDAPIASVIRFDAAMETGEVLGGWSANAAQVTGQTIDLSGTTAAAQVYRTGNSAQITDYAGHRSDRSLDESALGGSVSAPITAEGRVWGAVGVAQQAGRTIPAGAHQRLVSFAALVALAISAAEALETLSHQATTDPITGLANYRLFHERLGSEVQRAARHRRALSVAVLDLDNFKQVNDTHGHQIGDQVLAEVARRLAGAVRSGELMARVGGEEFAWLMPEATHDTAYLAAERVRQAILHTPFTSAGTLTISIGVCSNNQAQTAEELVGFADQALYWSKQAGRNTTFIYTPETPRALLEAAPASQPVEPPHRQAATAVSQLN
jgi:diguanylate cyclase (GGDEF)-like protein/PAS domain S-box-containing protein